MGLVYQGLALSCILLFLVYLLAPAKIALTPLPKRILPPQQKPLNLSQQLLLLKHVVAANEQLLISSINSQTQLMVIEGKRQTGGRLRHRQEIWDNWINTLQNHNLTKKLF